MSDSADNGDISLLQKLLLLLINYIPLFHTISIVAVFAAPIKGLSLPSRAGIAIAVLYLLPPLCARTTLLLFPIRDTEIKWGSRDAFLWWFLHSLQILFTRLSFLEELLRVVPGLYSMWLRLWGAKIGALTYWAPGVTILDRSFVKIGNHVVFGAGVRLNPHVFTKDAGEGILILAPVEIGDKAMVGGYCLLLAGSKVEPGETVIGTTVLPPFAKYADGRRKMTRNPDGGKTESDLRK